MEEHLDTLAKAMAGGLSRREALRRLGGGLAAIFLSALGLSPAWGQRGSGGDACNNYCRTHFAPGAAQVQCQRVRSSCLGGVTSLCTGGPTQGVVCCGSGQTCCTTALGVPYCATLAQDTRNCGQCGFTCPSGASCVAGVCVCPAGDTVCSNTCVNLQSNVMNCGACGKACANHEICCNGTCADTSSDISNCGTCGKTCTDPFNACCGGTCVFLSKNANNCGACGIVCPSGVCLLGHCVCSAASPNCPPGQTCDTSTGFCQ